MSVVANVAINVDSRNAVSKLRQVESQAKITERAFEGLSSALAAFGAGFAISKIIQDVKELDTNIRRLATVGVDVAKINPALSALSKELGGVASKAELAAASYQAASAGFSDTAGNVNILRAATKAAVGGLADTQAVTEVLVKTLNSYGMSGSQAIQVTDSISKAVELGNQEWSDYTSQLGRVASMAALAGVSLDETNAFIASATKNGATAEVAFTGLSAVLTQLLQPTKESQKAAAKLGVQWNLMGLQTKGLGGLMEELAAAIDKDKEAAARMVGPTEAMRGAFAAASKDGSDFKNILEQIGSAAGKTDADFQTMKGSLENTLKALDTSFKNLSEALGAAFGPTVVITVQDITKAVDGFADFMATVPQPVMNTAGELVKLIAQMLLLQKAIQAIIALRAAFIGAMASMTGATVASGTAATASASAFAMYTNNTRALQAQAATATPVLVGLRNVLSSIAAIGVITVAVNIAISGFQSLLAANAELDKLRGRKAAGGAAAMFAGSSKEEVSRQQAIARKTLEHEQKILKGLQSPGSRVAQFVNLGGVLEGLGVPSIQSASRREMQAKARISSAQAALGLNANRFPSATPAPVSNATGTPVGATVGGGGGGGGGGAEKAAEKAAREAEKLRQELERSLEVGDQLGTQFSRQVVLLDTASETERKRLQIQYDFEDRAKQIGELKNAEQRINLTDLNNEIKRLETLKLQTDEIRKQLEEYYKRAGLKADEMLPGGAGAFRTDINLMPNTGEQQIAKYKEELQALTNPINMAITGANAIGDAFGAAFQDIAIGAKSTEEALADAFKSIGSAFISMATEIIAKQMAMIIFQTILKALGGGGGGLFSGAGPVQMPGGGGFAEGFSLPSLLPGRANGGPVSGNQPYIVGERGPELFVPSVSGSVVSNADTRAALAQQATNRQMNAGGSAMQQKPIEVKYESTVINGVEYVTTEQHQRGIALAAERGRALTLQTLQNSVKTRKRVGMA